jgi:hypothetical protein
MGLALVGGWDHGEGGPVPLYAVERDGTAWLAREAWPDPQGAAVAVELRRSA